MILSFGLLNACQQKIGSESSGSLVGTTVNEVKSVSLISFDGAIKASDNSIYENCYDYRIGVLYDGQGSGLYWIDSDGEGGNPAFKVHCDMEFDGGGWTLVGRGRESWSWNNAGKDILNVASDVGTQDAFVPAYLASSTIDEIVNSVDISSLNDGIRIKRSAGITGSSYQEVKWILSTQESWSWLFDTSLALDETIIDGVSHGDGNTRDDYNGGSNDVIRVFTWAWGGHASKRGFSYGSRASFGSNTADAFCFEQGNENHCIPYSEVYVRQ